MRNNPILWRIARWLYSELAQEYLEYARATEVPWEDLSIPVQNDIYDKAAVLYAKIQLNEFTGPDNHSD